MSEARGGNVMMNLLTHCAFCLLDRKGVLLDFSFNCHFPVDFIKLKVKMKTYFVKENKYRKCQRFPALEFFFEIFIIILIDPNLYLLIYFLCAFVCSSSAVLMHTGYCRPTASPPPPTILELCATIRVLPPQECKSI